MCQRPERASFISTYFTSNIDTTLELCQRPERASFISTDMHGTYIVVCWVVCQRPERASFISTLPSRSPHKHWLCRLIFAGICLKILKSSIFCSFFGMFTVCSYFQLIFQPLPYKHYTLASSKMKVTFLIFVSTSYLQPLSSILN